MATKPVTMGRISIAKDKCKGCEYCIMYCPRKCIAESKDLNVRGVQYAVFVAPTKCTACGICARVCPDVCIEVYQRVGAEFYQKVGETITNLIDKGLDKLRSVQSEMQKPKTPEKRDE